MMKQLKSRSHDLRNLFEGSITIEYVAESLKAVSAEAETVEVLQFMEEHDFDVIGIETEETIIGYAKRTDLEQNKDGKCGDYRLDFHHSELIAISTPLIELLPMLAKQSRLFVLDCNQVNGIVTCGDLQKAPVRMLLFSLITLLEMNLLRIIRCYYPQNSWQKILKPERVQAAQKLWQESQLKNEATELIDYLQFCDKRDLLLHKTELVDRLQLKSKRSADRLLKSIEQLRNRLAHAQNLVNASSWSDLITLAAELESLLISCEKI